MARFRYRGRDVVEANGYTFSNDQITEVPDDDTATIRKLRGAPGGKSHPSFEEV